MPACTKIIFVRHGHVHNAENVFYGRLPRFRLSELGYNQAQAAATKLRDEPITVAYCSPLLRARQTAQCILSFHPGVAIRRCESLNEVHCPYDGQPIEAVVARNWDIYEGSGPEYEQPLDVLKRTLLFVQHVRHLHSGGHVLAATHGEILACMKLWALGIVLNAKNKEIDYPSPGAIYRFSYETDDPEENPMMECIIP
jgi:broad specificity phosphatase PhoE